jgi:uroporphyrin-III C-methyltransferase / precorrin-2 dehydrogenase / sirohydrochlorin ferrochelatase
MELLPLFVNLRGRRVLLVGGGPVAAAKLQQLLAVGAQVMVVAPDVVASIERTGVQLVRRGFVPDDLDQVWLAVAAATPEVNAEVASAAEARQVIVNAVDDPANATAYFGGVIRRRGLTIAISSEGAAPGLTALVREALEALLPVEVDAWVEAAARARESWRRRGVPIAARRPLLLETLNRLYDREKTS